ncbi:MAG: preprotein translocase subunit YajC [Bacillota bacterium]|jgi:preprotein translocase subunit YajC|nr:preprotein translocase subunit YajC [Bacillota bacterium]NLL60184.1 preprotein translocase subunit YajC [Tissierellia bacterium]
MPQEYSGIIMLVAFFAIMYFTMIRPQKKKEKEIKAMRDSLSTGDEVITIGGIHGKVVKVSDEIVTLEMPFGKQRLEFSKWAIGSVTKKGKEKAPKEEVEETVDDKKEEDK